PAIDVSLEILNRDGVLQRMMNNLDDLYIMSQPPQNIDLTDDVFLDNPLVMIAAASNPLCKQHSLTLSALKEQRFILREQGSGTRMGVDQFFKKYKWRPNIRMELGSNEAVKEAVAGGLGIGVVSQHALHGHQKEHGVAMVRVQGFPIRSSWHIVHAKRKKLSPIAAAFKKHLIQEIKRTHA
ncbi:MAG: LysR substrate-binding domain-containing protein, partial [Limnohabitans sp.]